MRNSGNFQQQSLMLRIRKKVKSVAVCLFAGGVLTTTACTRMPVNNASVMPDQVSAGKMQLVAQASVGTTTRYVDAESGRTVVISVLSEYFSAGGRKCRRFSQSSGTSLLGSATASDLSAASLEPLEPTTNGLACEDSKRGWIEIPIQSIEG